MAPDRAGRRSVRRRTADQPARTHLTRTTMPVTPHPESAPSLPEAEARRLDDAAARLVDVATHSLDPAGGFGWLDDAGRLTPGRPAETWVTCRMTHTFALAHLHGDARAADLVDHGVQALRTTLHDDRHGGWLSAAGKKDGARRRMHTPSSSWPRPPRRASVTRTGGPCSTTRSVSWSTTSGTRARVSSSTSGTRRGRARPLPRRQRQHAHGRVVPRRGGRDGRPGLARPRDARADPGRRRLRARRTTGGCRSTSTSSGARCSTTTSTTPATRSSPTA